MSAIRWSRASRSAEGARDCVNDCLNEFRVVKTGRWDLTIIGRDAGAYCEKCKKSMSAAWDGALEPASEPVAVAA